MGTNPKCKMKIAKIGVPLITRVDQNRMDDADINISVNLVGTDTLPDRTKLKSKPKIFGNRVQRIKQRRSLKLQKLQDAKANTQSPSKEAKSSKVSNKRAAVGKGEEQAQDVPAKKQKLNGRPSEKNTSTQHKMHRGEPVSSLFKHNPEIPTVVSTNIRGIKEEVFSSTTFQDLALHPHLTSALEQRLGLTTMTRVQQLSVPVILKNKDVLIKSQTGSGKTLAYAVPVVNCLINHAEKIKRQDGPYVLVIVPTRELAVQSLETFSTILKCAVWIVAGCLMGGEKRKAEKARIRKGINILIGTPGRILDHIQHTDCLSLSKLQWLILDEADRLLDLGYEKDVAQIVTALNIQGKEQRQTILLSATLTAGVERLAGMTLRDHEMIDASSTEKESLNSKSGQGTVNLWAEDAAENHPFALPEKLKQYFVIVPCKLRLVTLAAFILWRCKMQTNKSKMVVFLSTQDSVEFHHQLFSQVLNSPTQTSGDLGEDEEDLLLGGSDELENTNLFKLHGDMSQKERTKVFQDFTSVQHGVLLCTDVASRGLHLPKVDWIVQYSTPGATVDYIHRVGRTARAGKHGNALLFLMPSETEYIKELNKHRISLREVSMKDILPTLLTVLYDLPLPPTVSKRQDPRTFEEAATYLQDRFEECVLRDSKMQTLAAKGYQSFVRAYATYPSSLKDVFSMKDLHLGHVAKSFALRQTPSHLSGIASRPVSKAPKNNFKPRVKAEFAKERPIRKKLPLSATVSEFGSGLDSHIGLIKKKMFKKK